MSCSGCILMTYESRQPGSKGRASQPRAKVASAIQGIAGCSCAFGRRLLHLSPAGLSLPAASRAFERTCGCDRIEVGIHRKASAQFDSAGAVVRICQTALDQRGGQPRVARAAATRARSWLRPSHFHHVLFSWNIVLTVCCPTSWPRSFSYWCRINAGRSQPQSRSAIHQVRR
jgi:hypothetical protein